MLDCERSKLLPNVPTIAEAGVPGYEAMGWIGVVGPKGTPAAIIAKLNGHIRDMLGTPDVETRLSALGSEPRPTTPGEMEALIRSQFGKWGEVVREANLKPE